MIQCEVDVLAWNRSYQWFLLPTIVVSKAVGSYWIMVRFLKASIRIRLWREKNCT